MRAVASVALRYLTRYSPGKRATVIPSPLSPYGFAIKRKQFAKYGGARVASVLRAGATLHHRDQQARGPHDRHRGTRQRTRKEDGTRHPRAGRRRYWAFCINGCSVGVSKIILKITHRKFQSYWRKRNLQHIFPRLAICLVKFEIDTMFIWSDCTNLAEMYISLAYSRAKRL